MIRIYCHIVKFTPAFFLWDRAAIGRMQAGGRRFKSWPAPSLCTNCSSGVVGEAVGFAAEGAANELAGCYFASGCRYI